MYKVFFADDEASMRAGIRKNIDWDNSGFTLVGEAPDGELALSLMQETMPDILITDVKMPFMDGIELSRRAKKAMPWLKIVILSGHDEFDYAKQAITIGVYEYLLKPVTSSKLMDTLKEIAAVIEDEKAELINIERLMDDTRQVQIERLLSGILYGNMGLEDALAKAKELNLLLESDCFLIMLIELHPLSMNSYSLFQKAGAIAMGVLSGWENAVFFGQGLDRIICILKGTEDTSLIEEAYTCAQGVKHEVERNVECSVSVAIGTAVNKINEWPKSLADANMARQYLSLVNRNQIISMQDIRSGGLIPFNEIKKLPALDKLRYSSKSDIPRLLEDYFTDYDGLTVASLMFVNYIYMDILMAASKMIEELEGNSNEILSEFSHIGVLTGENTEDVKKMLISALERAIDFRDSKTGSKYYDVITTAQQYILENYDRQEISLQTVAKEVNMSPNHFSTIFSQETGETFINYLTRIRLEEAKALLKTTNIRASDIAFKVGYNDTHYFSYVFKKNTGMTPKEFRK